MVKSMFRGNQTVLFYLLIQAQSSEPAYPVDAATIDHLLLVGEGLLRSEVQTYEQGICVIEMLSGRKTMINVCKNA